MLGSYAQDLEFISDLLEAALEVLAGLHQVLDIVDVGKVELKELKKLALRLGQILVRQEVEQVPKIVA